MKKQALLGYLCAMTLFGTLGVFVRHVAASSEVLAFLRTLLGALLLGSLLVVQRQRITRLDKKQIRMVIVSAAFLGGNWVFLFEAYTYTTISTATMLYYTAPILALLGAVVLFHDTLRPAQILACVLAGIGVLCILRLDIGRIQYQGVVFGLLAALCYAGVILSNRTIQHIDALYFTFLQLAIAALMLGGYLLVKGSLGSLVHIPIASWPYILCIAFVHTGIAYLLYFRSLHVLSSVQVSVGSYLDPCVALVISIVFLQEPATLLQGLGIFLIMAGIVCSDFPSFQKG